MDRAWRVLARTLHIMAIALVVGGVAQGAPVARVSGAFEVAVASGAVLLALDLWRGLAFLHQGAGVAVLLKLALLAVGHAFPVYLFPSYLAATAVASVGSHMSKRWRHFSLLCWKVIDPPAGGARE
jgi:hypothetical protein